MVSTIPFRFRPRVLALGATLILAATALGACSPTLDWRSVRPKGVNILITYPCKPEQVTQPVELAGEKVPMSMTGCVAGDMTFALAHATLASEAHAAQALSELHRSAVANVRGTVTASSPAQFDQASADPSAQHLSIDGHMPDGKVLREQVALFRQGRDVFQLTTLGPTDKFQSDAAQTFADSVRLSPAP